jgi:hypothetical protein
MDRIFLRMDGCKYLVLLIGFLCLAAADPACAGIPKNVAGISRQSEQPDNDLLWLSMMPPAGPTVFVPESLFVLHFDQNTLSKKYASSGASLFHPTGRHAAMTRCLQRTADRRAHTSCQFMCKLQI